MKHDVEELKRVNAGLQDDVEELRQDNAGSKRDNTGMKHDVRKLGDQIDETNRAALGDKIAIGKIRRRTYGLTQSRKIPLSKYSTFQKNFVLVMRAVELTLEISVPSSSALLWVSASVSNNFTATSSATSSATIFSAETILTTMTLTNKGEVIRGQPRANPASSSPPSESENSHQFPPSPSGIHENQQLPPPVFAVAPSLSQPPEAGEMIALSSNPLVLLRPKTPRASRSVLLMLMWIYASRACAPYNALSTAAAAGVVKSKLRRIRGALRSRNKGPNIISRRGLLVETGQVEMNEVYQYDAGSYSTR
ncbi:hypothetical protein F4604DRAFT_1687801 [Suillus subluteus]|nr:hypothetical protein F4604DRAFT_1687801 [Suillus subluteus]